MWVAVGLLVPAAWVEGGWGLTVGSLPLAVVALAVSAGLVVRGWSTWRQLGWRGGKADVQALAAGIGVGLLMAAGALAL
ncbi:MAG: hypothetical protein GTN84_19155, partial [Hydrogenophaga sp.]|uniref:hypothetical protein n=1 Tax=Hydrogenophaga sp. TaxID=1904254 RepID=UPI0016A2863F